MTRDYPLCRLKSRILPDFRNRNVSLVDDILDTDGDCGLGRVDRP